MFSIGLVSMIMQIGTYYYIFMDISNLVTNFGQCIAINIRPISLLLSFP